MVELQVELSDEIAEIIRRSADARGVSVPAYLADIVLQHIVGRNAISREMQRGWPEGYFEEVIGSWEGDFPDVEKLPYERRDTLEG